MPDGRDVIGRWLPGVSGNQGGRPAVAAEIRELARQHAPEAIERLVELMRGGDPRVAVLAAREVLDRGLGKAERPAAEGAGSLLIEALTLVRERNEYCKTVRQSG